MNEKIKENKMKKNIKLEEILTYKMGGQYDYKLDDTFYQIYKYKQYWIVYETSETEELGTPCEWRVVIHTDTLKEAKLELINYINK